MPFKLWNYYTSMALLSTLGIAFKSRAARWKVNYFGGICPVSQNIKGITHIHTCTLFHGILCGFRWKLSAKILMIYIQIYPCTVMMWYNLYMWESNHIIVISKCTVWFYNCKSFFKCTVRAEGQNIIWNFKMTISTSSVFPRYIIFIGSSSFPIFCCCFVFSQR